MPTTSSTTSEYGRPSITTSPNSPPHSRLSPPTALNFRPHSAFAMPQCVTRNPQFPIPNPQSPIQKSSLDFQPTFGHNLFRLAARWTWRKPPAGLSFGETHGLAHRTNNQDSRCLRGRAKPIPCREGGVRLHISQLGREGASPGSLFQTGLGTAPDTVLHWGSSYH